MDQNVKDPAVTRGRVLLLALLGACTWLLLSIVTGGTAAVADDQLEKGGVLLGNLTAPVDEITVDEIVQLTTVIHTLNQITEPSAGQLAPVVGAVAAAAEPVLDPVLQPVLEPVLQQPLISDTVNILSQVDVVSHLVNDLADDRTGAVIDIRSSHPPIFAEMPTLVTAAYEPGPAAVKVNAVTPDTRATSIPAAGSLSPADMPDAPAPVAPVQVPAPALGQASSAPALLASLESDGEPLSLAVASVASATFAWPSSPAFDNDSSPD